MAYSGNRGLTRIIKAWGYSIAGFRACFRHEEAFRQEALASVVMIPLGLWLGDGGIERALLVGSWLLVLIVEVLNSAIEAAIDRIGGEFHDLSARAKDMGSAAVFLSLTLVVVTWALILL